MGWVLARGASDRDAGLFDLASDPGERADLRARAGLAARLANELDVWERGLLPPLSAGPIPEVDGETPRQLEALGYSAPD